MKRQLSVNDVQEIVKGHQKYLRDPDWHQGERADFSDSIIPDTNFENADLRYANFRGADFFDSTGWHPFWGADLSGADFTWADVSSISFAHAKSVAGAIFVDTNVSHNQFSGADYSKIYLTEREAEQAKKIEDQGAILDRVSEASVDGFKEIFEGLNDKYALEEWRWMVFVGVTFFGILGLSLLPILFGLGFKFAQYSLAVYALLLIVSFFWLVSGLLDAVESVKKNENETKLQAAWNFVVKWAGKIFFWVVSIVVVGFIVSPKSYDSAQGIPMEKLSIFIPLDVALLVFLYFSVTQYSKAKKLRIEQQNKLAMIQFYVAFEAKGNKEHLSLLLPKFADVLIREAMPDKNSPERNLPLDEMAKVAELVMKGK